MSDLLKHLHGEGRVSLPYRNLSKNGLAAAARRTGLLDKVLPYVFSCYRPSPGLHCGECKACIRLWAACKSIGAEGYAPQFKTYPAALPAHAFMEVFEGRGEERDAALQAYQSAN